VLLSARTELARDHNQLRDTQDLLRILKAKSMPGYVAAQPEQMSRTIKTGPKPGVLPGGRGLP